MSNPPQNTAEHGEGITTSPIMIGKSTAASTPAERGNFASSLKVSTANADART